MDTGAEGEVRLKFEAGEGVNEGTAQVEKVPLGSFLEGGPSRIIFLTPLQEGLMTLSKDDGLEEEGGVMGEGGGEDIQGRCTLNATEEVAKKRERE